MNCFAGHIFLTGIDLQGYRGGDGKTFRRFFDIPHKTFLVGIISRIAPEKNILFLNHAVTEFGGRP